MGTKSRKGHLRRIGPGRRRAGGTSPEGDRLAYAAWNKRMLGFHGPAQPSPALGDAINAGFGYLEVKCLGCNNPPDGRARHRAPTEGGADPSAGALHVRIALGYRAAPTSAAIWWRCGRRDFGGRSALNMVAGRAIIQP